MIPRTGPVPEKMEPGRHKNPGDPGANRLLKSILGIVMILLLMLILIGVYSVINWTLYVDTQ